MSLFLIKSRKTSIGKNYGTHFIMIVFLKFAIEFEQALEYLTCKKPILRVESDHTVYEYNKCNYISITTVTTIY